MVYLSTTPLWKRLFDNLLPNGWHRMRQKISSWSLEMNCSAKAGFVEVFGADHEASRRIKICSMRSNKPYPFVAVALYLQGLYATKRRYCDLSSCCRLELHNDYQALSVSPLWKHGFIKLFYNNMLGYRGFVWEISHVPSVSWESDVASSKL